MRGWFGVVPWWNLDCTLEYWHDIGALGSRICSLEHCDLLEGDVRDNYFMMCSLLYSYIFDNVLFNYLGIEYIGHVIWRSMRV